MHDRTFHIYNKLSNDHDKEHQGILGVGLAGGIGALNLSVVRNIFISWIITIPVGAGLTILFFYFIKALF